MSEMFNTQNWIFDVRNKAVDWARLDSWKKQIILILNLIPPGAAYINPSNTDFQNNNVM